MNTSHKPATVDPSPQGKPAKASDLGTTLEEITKMLQELSASITPLIEFHKEVENATADDLRLFWDVRVSRGRKEPFAHLTGNTPLPGILSGKLRALGPSMIETEITNKILTPLGAKVQTEVEQVTFERLAAEGRKSGSWAEEAGCPSL
jgi:hypothetical protein